MLGGLMVTKQNRVAAIFRELGWESEVTQEDQKVGRWHDVGQWEKHFPLFHTVSDRSQPWLRGVMETHVKNRTICQQYPIASWGRNDFTFVPLNHIHSIRSFMKSSFLDQSQQISDITWYEVNLQLYQNHMLEAYLSWVLFIWSE